MGQMKNQSFWKVPSRFCREGLYQYVFWNMGSGELSAPSDPLMHVVFVRDGVANYGDIIARAGDVLACGVNKQPMSSLCKGLSLFTIDMDFFLFYRITGIVPSLLGENSAEFLLVSNPFYQLGQRLFTLPIHCWVDKIEEQIEKWLGERKYYAGAQLERVAHASQVLFHNGNADLDRLSSQFSISYRQIQRDFLAVLGVTPKE
ncbi:MAG: Helix-turn-helix, AraC domain, partial [Firmicutes bacterium]|nr:Helix-turn-helix, AraC domain [Bacillota bacterium]